MTILLYLCADKLTDREKLFHGGTNDDIKPRLRTAEEIKAKYRKAGVITLCLTFLLFILIDFGVLTILFCN